MKCQNCGFPHANPLGCISCGWKFDPNYHPALGSGPDDAAKWVLDQSEETLVKLFGVEGARAKLAAAQAATAPVAAAPMPEPPLLKPAVITHTVEPVASPNAKS